MIEYSKITIDDLKQVTSMYETYLNSGDYIEKHIKEGIVSPDFVGYKAEENGKMIGLLTVYNGPEFTYPHPEIESAISEKYKDDKICTPDSLIVLSEYRGTDVSFQLGKLALEDVYKRGYTLLVCELWIYPNGHIPADHIFRKWGEVVYEKNINNFYKDLHKYDMICPICGKYCICGAQILIVRISEDAIKNYKYEIGGNGN